MALFNLIELFRLLCLSQKMDLKNFVTAKIQRKVVELFFFPIPCLLSPTLSADGGIFRTERYSVSVTVVYLLMCWRLKLGREYEPAR